MKNRPLLRSRRGGPRRTASHEPPGPMSDRIRRGMLIKNSGSEAVEVSMASRRLHLDPGEESFITPEEVRDATLRRALQERSIAIVRPATPAEDEALRDRLDDQ